VQSRIEPRRLFVIADPIYPIHDLDRVRHAPAGHEGARDRRLGEIDGQRIIHDASDTGGVIAHASAPQLASSHAMI